MKTVTFEEELQRILSRLSEDPAIVGEATKGDDSTVVVESTTKDKAVNTDLVVHPTVSKVTLKNLFTHPDAHPVVLDLAMLLRYGGEWLFWEPETVRVSVSKDVGGMSELAFSKLMAMKTLHVSDAPWKHWEAFLMCAMPLNDLFPDPDHMQVPSVSQVLVAVDIMKRVRDVAWAQEVKLYIGVVHRHDGVLCTQPPIDFVEVDTSGIDIDCADVDKRWPDVRKNGSAPTKMTMEDEQLRRLLICYENLQEHMTRLRTQLPLVSHAT